MENTHINFILNTVHLLKHCFSFICIIFASIPSLECVSEILRMCLNVVHTEKLKYNMAAGEGEIGSELLQPPFG